MRQIVADDISKFQKITRQMLCDKCSKNDVTLILKMLTSYGREDPQNADVTSAAGWGLISTAAFFIRMHVTVVHRHGKVYRPYILYFIYLRNTLTTIHIKLQGTLSTMHFIRLVIS